MAIDGCPHTFHELATRGLPKYMEQMRAALAAPVPMSLLTGPKWQVLARFGHGPRG